MKQPLLLVLLLVAFTHTLKSSERAPLLRAETPPPTYEQATKTTPTNKAISNQPTPNNYYQEQDGRLFYNGAYCLPSSCYDSKSFTSRYCPLSSYITSVFCEITSCCCCCQYTTEDLSYDEQKGLQQCAIFGIPIGSVIAAVGVAASTVAVVGDIVCLPCNIYNNGKNNSESLD